MYQFLKKTLGVVAIAAMIVTSIPIYSYAEDPDAGEVTVTFINGETIWDTKTFPAGNPVDAPEVPEPSGNQTSFIGWFTQAEGGEQFDFPAEINESVSLYARFESQYLVNFQDSMGKIIDSQQVSLLETATPSKAEVSAPDGKSFAYWYVEGDESKSAFDFSKPIDRNLVLCPEFKEENVILYISEGTQVDPSYVAPGEIPEVPDNPVRVGYEFSHWSIQKDGETPYDFTAPVSENITLYAVWKPIEVSYKVAFWNEKPNVSGDPGKAANNYEYIFTEDVTGSAGDSATITAEQAQKYVSEQLAASNSGNIGKLKYSKYSYADEKVISGSGNTVINVYYKRNIYNLRFLLKQQGLTLTMNGVSYTSADDQTSPYTIMAKYEQSIEDQWPADPTSDDPKKVISGWEFPSNTPLSGKFTTGNGMTLSENYISSNGKASVDMVPRVIDKSGTLLNTRTMYIESIDSVRKDNPDYEFTQADYTLSNFSVYDIQEYYDPKNNSYIEDPIYGYTFLGKKESGTTQGSYYYKRNTHILRYNLQGGNYEGANSYQEKHRFGDSIKEPEGIPKKEGYMFAGWYKDSDYTEKVNFQDLTIKDENIVYFAKWESTENIVTYYDKKDGQEITKQGYGSGEYAKFPQEYVPNKTFKEDMGVFKGWYWTVGGQEFSFSDTIPITKDIQLYAKWRTDGFTLTYNQGEAKGEAPIDEKTYDLLTRAEVFSEEGLTAPKGKAFIGWKSTYYNQLYYPGQSIKVPGEDTLTATFADKDSVTQVIYHSNTETSQIISANIMKNSKIGLLGSVFKKDNCTLLGWSLQENGTVDYALQEQNVSVKEEPLNLYAVWEDNTPETTPPTEETTPPTEETTPTTEETTPPTEETTPPTEETTPTTEETTPPTEETIPPTEEITPTTDKTTPTDETTKPDNKAESNITPRVETTPTSVVPSSTSSVKTGDMENGTLSLIVLEGLLLIVIAGIKFYRREK